jgi:hypothetical protein
MYIECVVFNGVDNQVVIDFHFVLNKMRQIAGISLRSFRSGYE